MKEIMLQRKNIVKILKGPFRICYLLILIVIICCCSTPSNDIIICKKGKSTTKIILDENSSDEILFAAEELKNYIRKISGADLEITKNNDGLSGVKIYVGPNKALATLGVTAKSLNKEGFIIKTIDDNIVLLGYDDIGTQFAVYSFLEDYLGIRWLWPGELGEVVPQSATIRIKEIDVTQQAHFKWRNLGPDGALWGATSGPTEMHARELLLGITENHLAEVHLWEKRNKWGGMKISGGHSLSEIFPGDKYAKTHPEYYALVNGRRDVPGPNYDFKHGSQPCTTHPDVIRIAGEWATKFFDDHPDHDAVNMSMNDGYGYCECERCKALDNSFLDKGKSIDNSSITDRIYTYINQIAEIVQKKHPDKYIVCFAYGLYKLPPEKISLNPMVIPQFTLWSAYMHANDNLKRENMNNIKIWKDISNMMGIYEYYINGSWPGLPRIAVSLYAENIKELYEMGVELFQTQSGNEFATNGINYYVAGKLLWNTSLDKQELFNDYFEKGFGRAGEYVKQYFERMEKAWESVTRDGKDVSAGSLESSKILDLYTPELLDQCRQDLDKAAEVADTEVYKKRVEFIRVGLKYTELTVVAAQKTKDLVSYGIPVFGKQNKNIEIDPLAEKKDNTKAVKVDSNLSEHERQKLIKEALVSWEERDKFVEDQKNNHTIPYFWIKYNDLNRNFNPTKKLKALIN